LNDRQAMRLSGPGSGLLFAAALCIVIAGMRAASEILIPIVFASFLTVLVAPLVRLLRRMHVPTALAIVGVVASCIAVLVVLGGVVGRSVNAFIEVAPAYRDRAAQLHTAVIGWMHGHGVRLTTSRLLDAVRPDSMLSFVGQAISQVASLLTYTVLVLLMMVFMLFDALDMPTRMQHALNLSPENVRKTRRIGEEIKHYLVLKTYLCIVTGASTWLLLWLTGIDFAPVWALTALLLTYVPTFGPIAATLPPVFLALLQYGPGRMGLVAVLLAALHVTVGNVVEPQFFGRRLGLSALAVFVSLVVWGWLWGIAGMLLSVPLTMVIKISLENSEGWRWVAALLEPSDPRSSPKNPSASVADPSGE